MTSALRSFGDDPPLMIKLSLGWSLCGGAVLGEDGQGPRGELLLPQDPKAMGGVAGALCGTFRTGRDVPWLRQAD